MGKNKENNFKTPEGYFDSFHERLMDRIQGEETEMETSGIPKSDGFVVPDNYFENFNKEVLSKVEYPETKVIQLKSYRKVYYGIASVAAVLLLFFGLTWNGNETIAFEDLASAEIDAYFETADFNLSSYEIAEVVSLEEIELDDVLDNTLAEDNIMEYLDENVEDIEDLNLDYDDYE